MWMKPEWKSDLLHIHLSTKFHGNYWNHTELRREFKALYLVVSAPARQLPLVSLEWLAVLRETPELRGVPDSGRSVLTPEHLGTWLSPPPKPLPKFCLQCRIGFIWKVNNQQQWRGERERWASFGIHNVERNTFKEQERISHEFSASTSSLRGMTMVWLSGRLPGPAFHLPNHSLNKHQPRSPRWQSSASSVGVQRWSCANLAPGDAHGLESK